MKTEKGKMLAGELYRPSDLELTKERKNARRLTRLFNETMETEHSERLILLKELFGSTGKIYRLSLLYGVIMVLTSMSVKTFSRILIVCFWMYVKLG